MFLLWMQKPTVPCAVLTDRLLFLQFKAENHPKPYYSSSQVHSGNTDIIAGSEPVFPDTSAVLCLRFDEHFPTRFDFLRRESDIHCVPNSLSV